MIRRTNTRLGAVAIGGEAVGYSAIGGAAFGAHVVGGGRQDPEMMNFFMNGE